MSPEGYEMTNLDQTLRQEICPKEKYSEIYEPDSETEDEVEDLLFPTTRRSRVPNPSRWWDPLEDKPPCLPPLRDPLQEMPVRN